MHTLLHLFFFFIMLHNWVAQSMDSLRDGKMAQYILRALQKTTPCTSYAASLEKARTHVKTMLQKNDTIQPLSSIIRAIKSCDGNDHQKIAALLVAFPWDEHVEYPAGLKSVWQALNTTYTQETLDSILQDVTHLGHDEEYWKSRRYAIAALVYANANPRKTERFAHPLLQEAVLKNDMFAVYFLCLCGAIPKAGDLNSTKSVAIAKLLMEHGVHVERDQLQHLHFPYYDPRLILLYIQGGANPYAQDSDGYTLLHRIVVHAAFGASFDNLEKAQILLLQAPQLVHMKTKKHQTPKELLLCLRPDIATSEHTSAQLFKLLNDYEKENAKVKQVKFNGVC